MEFLIKLLDFLKENVPWLFLGYEIGKSDEEKLKAENIKLGLKSKELENAQTIKDHNSKLTDDELKSEMFGDRSSDSKSAGDGEKK